LLDSLLQTTISKSLNVCARNAAGPLAGRPMAWALARTVPFVSVCGFRCPARQRHYHVWRLCPFFACYAMSIMINATFDVTLDGPMQGIWFGCLFGFGIGSKMVYQAQAADGIAGSGR
jgi:hypothetical protein